MKKLTILGVTGSVGQQTADIAREYPDRLDVVCISAHKDIKTLAKTANDLRPAYIAITSEQADVAALKELLCYDAEILHGKTALIDACTAGEPDLVAHSILGIAGLPAFAECLKRRIPVALSNKESLVCGGKVVKQMMAEADVLVLPVDSEHSALFQCLNHEFNADRVRQLWLTASGGPFLNWSKEDIKHAPPERALKHPRWSMGQKITIDSASLANKGLEVIEAHYMYDMPAERIKVLIHPQSLIHSMVEWDDYSVSAQLGPVDMRMPIQKALLFPDMVENPCIQPLNFYEISKLEFLEPDFERFPCLQLAFDAIRGETTAVYNMANEEAVARYLNGQITFGTISELIEKSMCRFDDSLNSIEEIMTLDHEVRAYVTMLIETRRK